jgi:hypothetical protein
MVPRLIVLILLAWPLPANAFERYAALSNSLREKNEFTKALTLIIATVTPKLSPEQRERLVKDYADIAENKAQAVELSQGRYWRSGVHELQSVAGERALESCQLRYNKPCALIAVNDQITSDGSLVTKDMPRLHYAGKFDLDQIPVLRLTTRKRGDLQRYASSPAPKAIAIHPWGRLFISFGKPTLKQAEEEAIVSCNKDEGRNGRDGPCYLYAANDDVVLPMRLTAASAPPER